MVRALAPAALAFSLAAAPACAIDDRVLDVHADPLLIDTFEDGDLLSPDKRFRKWESIIYGTNASTSMRTYRVAGPGFESNYCLQDDWEMTDVPDGTAGFAALLVRIQALGSLDLTRYAQISFAHLYQHEGSCLAHRVLTVGFVCYELNSGLSTGLPISTAWTTRSVPLASFVTNTPGGPSAEDCLRVVDEIRISTPSPAGDGQCSSGSLFIDDVGFQ